MKLLCIKNDPMKIIKDCFMPCLITIGKEYETIDIYYHDYLILDDYRGEIRVPKNYFKKK